MRSSSHQSGFSLIELVISIVIIGIAVTGILSVMNITTRHSADPMIQQQALAIAEAYLEEIELRAFCDPSDPSLPGACSNPCPGAEAARDLYDNVCDYNGLSDSGARDQTGTAVTGLEDYTIDVTVTPEALSGIGVSNSLRIDVRVQHSNLVDITLSGYRTFY
jgi:MSHA pilin protein MshD